MNAIVCVDKNMGIGKDGAIPWHIPSDFKYFKKITCSKPNNIVVMGRKTYESIDKILPNRINVVLSKTLDNSINKLVFRNTKRFLKYYNYNYKCFDDCYIIGGEQIFKKFENNIDLIYLTEIDKDFKCDTKFPIDLSKFNCTDTSAWIFDNHRFRFKTFSRHK
jgi:dihydrofolate reductase